MSKNSEQGVQDLSQTEPIKRSSKDSFEKHSKSTKKSMFLEVICTVNLVILFLISFKFLRDSGSNYSIEKKKRSRDDEEEEVG